MKKVFNVDRIVIRVALEDEKKKEDVNFRIFKDRTQSGKR